MTNTGNYVPNKLLMITKFVKYFLYLNAIPLLVPKTEIREYDHNGVTN